MDVFFYLHGVEFVWDERKAASNEKKHGVRFDVAAEVFLDPLLAYDDASVDEEVRTAAIGRSFERRLLFAVHMELDDGRIRLISARDVTAKESTEYQHRRGDR